MSLRNVKRVEDRGPRHVVSTTRVVVASQQIEVDALAVVLLEISPVAFLSPLADSDYPL